ncbi:MAG: DUF2344 domain-containing protein [Clostridia bacterium]|nr:DUF2344 domain-containing protein [Clostridia bacterium]
MQTILRATFKKGETMRYTGHLDILRTFVRGLRRASFPIKYSEGFNPHAIMTFALPLGVGTTSECEIVDIAVKEQIPAEDFIKSVNACMPPDSIVIKDAEYTDQKLKEIVKAKYEIKIENETPVDYEALENIIAKSPIVVEKKSKHGLKEVDLAPHIFEHSIKAEDEKRFVLTVVISAGNKFNVKPQLLISGIQSVFNSLKPLYSLPCRKCFYYE